MQLLHEISSETYSETPDLRPPILPTKSGLKSAVVSCQELISIIKFLLGHNEVVLKSESGLSSGWSLVRRFTVCKINIIFEGRDSVFRCEVWSG